MLSGLFKNRQSINVGGPIGSMKDAKSQRLATLDYEAAYLAKRLTENPDDVDYGLDVNIDRYKPEKDIGMGQLVKFDQAEKTAFLLNAVKGYKAEAEESLKMEFKDWLAGKHYDNAKPSPYDNTAGGLERRDPSGRRLNNWHLSREVDSIYPLESLIFWVYFFIHSRGANRGSPSQLFPGCSSP
jgi:hypothetical protein